MGFTAKTSPGASAVVFQKTVGQGIMVTDAAGGVGVIELVPGDTEALGARTVRLYFDLEVEIAGAVYTVAAGRLVVEPDLTVRSVAYISLRTLRFLPLERESSA